MPTCPRCRFHFRTLPDEEGMHDCPRCGLEPGAPYGKACDRCGDDAVTWWDRGADHACWTGEPRTVPVCAECHRYFDNYEPPDPDGEAFRGGEAAAYQAELMDQARRLK